MYDGLLGAEGGLNWSFKERYVIFCRKKIILCIVLITFQTRNVQGVVKDEYDITMIKCKCL